MSETVKRYQTAATESREASRDLIVEVETLAARVATLREGNAELMRQRDEATRDADQASAEAAEWHDWFQKAKAHRDELESELREARAQRDALAEAAGLAVAKVERLATFDLTAFRAWEKGTTLRTLRDAIAAAKVTA